MVELHLHRFELHQKRPFKVSYGAYSSQRCVIAELRDQDCRGFGEATVFAAYGVTEAALTGALQRASQRLAAERFTTPQALRDCYLPQTGDCPFACAALDAAAWDLFGKIAGAPVHTLLGLPKRPLPPTAFSIGLESVEETAARVREVQDWPILKLKLGNDDDLARVAAVRAITGAEIRVDVNGGWGAAETIDKAGRLKELGVESIEQPLPADDWDGMAAIAGQTALPLYADEAVHSQVTFEAALTLFDGIALKTMKLGGITPTLAMIDQARAAGKAIALGCMPESTIGVSSTLQLATLADQLDIDSIALLRTDLAHGVQLDRGTILPTALPGLGFETRFPEPVPPSRNCHALS